MRIGWTPHLSNSSLNAKHLPQVTETQRDIVKRPLLENQDTLIPALRAAGALRRVAWPPLPPFLHL